MKQTRIFTASILLSLALSPFGLLKASDSGCGPKLASYGKSSARITSTLGNRVNIGIANAARWWINETTPAKAQAADNLIARLEFALRHDDRLADAVYLVKSHINIVEISYRLIKDQVAPMRSIFKNLRLDLNKKSSENLDESEIQTLESEFLGVAENYASTNSYSRFNGDRKNIRALRTIEELISKRNGKPINRAKIIRFLEGLESWMDGQETFYAKQIGRHFVKYERLKAYLSSSYEDRPLSIGTLEKLEDAPKESDADAVTASSEAPTKEEILAARKAKWDTNVRLLNERVGWNSDARARLAIESEAPTLAEVVDYYNQSHVARLVDNRSSSVLETFRSFVTTGIHLTGVGAIVRPSVAYAFSGPGKFTRAVNLIREWSIKTHKALILKDIQELVEAPETTLEKAANLASYASDANTGTYFLELFASDVDLYSKIVWKEIYDEVSSNPDHYYSVLAVKMKAAADKVQKDGILTSIQTSTWSPSQSASVVVWILGIGYYNFYGEDDEELDKRTSDALKEEISDVTGSMVKPEDPAQPAPAVDPEVAPETAPQIPENAPQVLAPRFEDIFTPEVPPVEPAVETPNPAPAGPEAATPAPAIPPVAAPPAPVAPAPAVPVEAPVNPIVPQAPNE